MCLYDGIEYIQYLWHSSNDDFNVIENKLNFVVSYKHKLKYSKGILPVLVKYNFFDKYNKTKMGHYKL